MHLSNSQSDCHAEHAFQAIVALIHLHPITSVPLSSMHTLIALMCTPYNCCCVICGHRVRCVRTTQALDSVQRRRRACLLLQGCLGPSSHCELRNTDC
jgi:hypothetical protein